ncbi:hypothetical protein [Tabrizicola sp.]|uniref:hypothetical protein n=1 Tax=Tabrizicola sp. TaxID=2005166 RepID=UPI002FDD757A
MGIDTRPPRAYRWGWKRSEGLSAAVAMRDDLGVKDASVKPALDNDRLSLCHSIEILAAWPQIDERMAAPVVEDELVPENLGNGTFHGSGVPVLQSRDRGRLQQHDLLRAPALCKLETDSTRRSTD